jgi:DNA repair photolyase
MQTIYQPKGKALEYAPLALNIYSGCSHGCTYCFMRPMHERFHGVGSFDKRVYRVGLLEALEKELAKGIYADKLIHLCFSCDPYQAGEPDSSRATRDVIKLLKQAGCHIQILTKAGAAAEKDFDLLDGQDWFGVTIAGGPVNCAEKEPGASSFYERVTSLQAAHVRGIKTWVSCEPVYNELIVYDMLESNVYAKHIDLYRIGKLNYHPSDINWGEFGRRCVELAKLYGRNVYIKDDLRKEMEK